jgi:hypothetical protein
MFLEDLPMKAGPVYLGPYLATESLSLTDERSTYPVEGGYVDPDGY